MSRHLRLPGGTAAAGLGLVLLLALALAAPASARKGPLMGVQSIIADRPTTDREINRELDLMRSLGSRIIRVELSWAALEPRARGERDPRVLATLDRVVRGAAKRRLKVLLFINRTPCWASSAPAEIRGDCSGANANRPDVWRYPPADPADAVPVSTFVAGRYGSGLTAFEIWNEPDQRNELYWAGPDKVRRYVALVRALYRPLKQASPRTQVLAGAFVGTNGAWLKALYDAGMRGYYDGLSVHFYGLPLYGLKNTRRVQLRHGDHKPMWLAEFGWSSCLTRKRRTAGQHRCVSRATQARNVSDLLRAVRRTPWLRAAILYNMRDDATGGYEFGVLDHKGRRKPAWRAVHRAMTERRGRAVRRATLRVTRRGGRIVARGSGSGADVYLLWAFVDRRVRYKAVVVQGFWTGHPVTRFVR